MDGVTEFLEENGYIVAAVLPEIEVTAEGSYVIDEEDVGALEEAAKTGAELVWLAFADKPTEDDEDSAVFSEPATGAETKVIPESRRLTVEAWFNADTKYAPVIAVKADAAEAEATTEEGLKAQAEEIAEEKAAEGETKEVELKAKEAK